MAYKNLVGVACVDGQEAFQRLRDFLCKRAGTYDYSLTGIGWVLHDAVYAVDENTLTAGDYIVIYSPGESGDDDMYIKIRYSETTAVFYTIGYLYWDNITHVGVVPFNVDYAVCPVGSGYRLWLYGDLDSFSVIWFYGTLYGGYYFGKAENLAYPDTVATSAAAVATGTDVAITLDAVPATWGVGQNVFIRDNSAIKKIIIKTIVGNIVTADIVMAMAAGCKLQADLSFMVPGSASFCLYGHGLVSHGGLSGAASAYLTGSYNAVLSSTNLPETMNGAFIAARQHFYDTNPDGYYGTARNVFFLDDGTKISEDVFTDKASGNSYRFFSMNSTRYYCFKEV